MAVALPHALEQRLAALVPRVRTQRVVRGLSLCIIAAVVATTFVLLLDALFTLPAIARGLFIAVWVTALGVLVWQLVLRPWHADISLSDVAGELAKRLPELAERLGAVVGEPHEGTSDAVRAALAEDANRRAKAVDFARAVPTYPAKLRVCGSLIALLGFLIVAGLVPNGADRLRRVTMPWARPASVGVRVIVTSGEPVVKRGGPVTLTAYAEKIDSRALAPDGAVLIYRDRPDAPEHRLSMSADGAGALHVTRPEVNGDFEYRVQISGATSEWFRVTALDAVELADGTRIEIIPPAYARRAKSTRDFSLLDSVLEHSDITLHLKFTRPAASVHLDFQPNSDARAFSPTLELSPDRLSATATIRALHSGVLRLAMVNDVDGKKLRTAAAIDVRVWPDRAPWFEEVSGVSPRPRDARPGARVPIRIVARDDMSVSTVVVEYVLDSFDSRTEQMPIPLTNAGTVRATGRLDFDLTGKGGEGATVRVRVRITDNRSADDPKLAPQEAFYPATGWSELRISATAPPLEEQDIAGQRDAFHESGDAARRAVREAAELVLAVSARTVGGALAVDDTARLYNARERIKRAKEVLHDLGRDAALAPELRPLATTVREIADRELKSAEDATLKVEADETGRADAFAFAVKQLGESGDKLDAVLVRNANLARARLDRAKLGALARDQDALAAAAKTGGNELLARQQELLARQRTILAESEPLRLAAEGAKGNEARRLALAITELSALLGDLDTATKRTATDARDTLVAAIASDQESLTARAVKLFVALDTAARLAGVAPPKLDDFRRVADLAAVGKTVEALTELEKQAQALERIAAEFDLWATDRTDPKKAAVQLARWQDDLLARLRTATKATEFDKLAEELKTAFRTEQKALHAALALLAIPLDVVVKAARDNAAIHTGAAHGFLSNDGSGAETAMKFAVDSLNRLADNTPSVAVRLAATLRAFDKFKSDQEGITKDAEKALRGHDAQAPAPATVAGFAKKLAPLVERQRASGVAFAALDLPGLGERRARVVAALAVAVADLQDVTLFDVLVSQSAVRREVERLKFVLEGNPTPDAKADELHRKLAALADALDLHGANLTAKFLEPGTLVVQDVQKQLERVVAPESPAIVNDAKIALQVADSGFRDGSKPDEARRRVRAAADALGRLSARLNGTETDLDRVYRLAHNRRLAAVRAKELADMKSPFSAPASDEAKRQLVREMDELAHTRVGAVGQFNKHRVFDLYARLRVKTEPDRLASDQRALAETLDELAAKMADIADLATLAPAAEPLAPPEADAYLPSRPLAETLRGLVKQQRTLHDGLTNFARALADHLKPASNAAVAQQIARGTELAARAAELSRVLELAAKGLDPLDPLAKALVKAAALVKDAEKRLLEAAQKSATTNITEAARLRTEVAALLQTASAGVSDAAPLSPAGANVVTGESLRAAELAMRAAIDDLTRDPPTPAEKAMRNAANALTTAAKNVGEP